MVLPHKVTQAAKNAHNARHLELEQHDVEQMDVEQQDERQVEVEQHDSGQVDAEIQDNENPKDPPITMVPTPDFRPHEAIKTSLHVRDPSSSAQGSRHMSDPNTQSGSLHVQTSDDLVQESRHSCHEIHKTTDGRPYIFPYGRGWNPCRVASRALTKVIESQFRKAWISWREIPDKRVNRMFMKFGKIVAWRPEDEFELKSIFKSKGSKRLSEILMDARKKQERPSWMGEGAWKGLKIKWETPEYKVKAARNKKNRASAKGGSVHTGGSISTNEHIIRMRRELGREPTLDEVFLRTHTKKKDSSWVDDRSKKTYETFQEKLKHASQVGETSNSGPKEVDSATRLNFWAEATGGKTRGRLYGVGDLSKHYKPGVSSLITQQSRVSTCSGQVSAEIAAQMATIEERENAAEEDARVAREECRKANKRTQDLERQLRELDESVASIKGDKRRRRHSDYDDDSDSDDDSIGSI
ncbi:unnamed protein product [Lathyrus sativus]|nr:unnamed protein product [Lathyrus sativus]